MRALPLALAAAAVLCGTLWWTAGSTERGPLAAAVPAAEVDASVLSRPVDATIAEDLRLPVTIDAKGTRPLSWTRRESAVGAATFEVHVRDAAGAPVAEALVTTRAAREWDSDTTGEGGVATLRWTEDLRRVQVHARGFARHESAAPATGRVLDVVLQPTNRLTIEVREVDGTPWADGLVELKAGAAGPSSGFAPGFHTIRPGTTFRLRTRGGKLDARESLRTDAEGRIEIEELAADGRFELVALDVLRREGARASISPLGPHERRTQRVDLTSLAGRLQGRVLDLGGRPIGGAGIELAAGDEHATARCDEHGRIHAPRLFAGEIELTVSAPGRAARIESVDPADGLQHEFRLAPGRDLTVWLRDPHDVPVPLGTVEVLDVHGGPVPCRRQDGGSFVDLRNLPLTPLDVLYRHHGRTLRRRIESEVERVDWILPAFGTLEARIDFGAGAGGGPQRLHVLALDAADVAIEPVAVEPSGIRNVRLSLWPGRYRLEVLGIDGESAFCAPPPTVALLGGRTTQAVLGP